MISFKNVLYRMRISEGIFAPDGIIYKSGLG